MPAWLFPVEGFFGYIIIFCAIIIGLVISFFLSFFVELWIIKKCLKNKKIGALVLKKAVWNANLVSYGVLLIAIVVYFVVMTILFGPP